MPKEKKKPRARRGKNNFFSIGSQIWTFRSFFGFQWYTANSDHCANWNPISGIHSVNGAPAISRVRRELLLFYLSNLHFLFLSPMRMTSSFASTAVFRHRLHLPTRKAERTLLLSELQPMKGHYRSWGRSSGLLHRPFCILPLRLRTLLSM